nr:P0 protein [Qingdao RNA virus 1]
MLRTGNFCLINIFPALYAPTSQIFLNLVCLNIHQFLFNHIHVHHDFNDSLCGHPWTLFFVLLATVGSHCRSRCKLGDSEFIQSLSDYAVSCSYPVFKEWVRIAARLGIAPRVQYVYNVEQPDGTLTEKYVFSLTQFALLEDEMDWFLGSHGVLEVTNLEVGGNRYIGCRANPGGREIFANLLRRFRGNGPRANLEQYAICFGLGNGVDRFFNRNYDRLLPGASLVWALASGNPKTETNGTEFDNLDRLLGCEITELYSNVTPDSDLSDVSDDEDFDESDDDLDSPPLSPNLLDPPAPWTHEELLAALQNAGIN